MKKQKKLILNKETLRDLTVQNAGEVKGGAQTYNKRCWSQARTCYCWPTYGTPC